MPPVGFEPMISAGERPQTYALDRAATGTGLTEISTSNISWGGEGGRCVGLTTLPPSCADCLEIWEPQPPGTLRVYPDLYRDYFALLLMVTLFHCTILLVFML